MALRLSFEPLFSLLFFPPAFSATKEVIEHIQEELRSKHMGFLSEKKEKDEGELEPHHR